MSAKFLPAGAHLVCITKAEVKDSTKDNGMYMAVTLECISGDHKGAHHIDRWTVLSADSQARKRGEAREFEYRVAACGLPEEAGTLPNLSEAMFRPFVVELEPSRLDAERMHVKKLHPSPPEWQFIAEDICEELRKKSPSPPRHGRGLVLQRGSDVRMKPIRWLWRSRFAIGKLSMMSGDPGLGKSSVSLMMAAKVSTGGAWPNNEGNAPLGNVLILCCEDDVSDTVGPRLVAAGANMERIYIAEAVHVGDQDRMFNMAADIEQLDVLLTKAAAANDAIKLIIVDPISAYMGDVNTDKQSEVRAVLGPYKALAEKHGVAIVAVAHPPKNVPSGKAVNAVAGSGGFVGAVRAVWVFSKEYETDPETRERTETGRVLMLEAKQNVAKAKGLAYRVEQATVPTDEGPAETSYVIFDDGDVETTADDAFKPAGGFGHKPLNKTEAAKALLMVEIGNGPQEVNQLVAKAKEKGISYDTLNRAREAMGIQSVRTDFGGLVMWAYPNQPVAPAPGQLFA